MRGFGGLTEAIDSVLGSFGVSLPPWAFPALLVVGFVALFPHIRQNQRTNKARIKIRECSESGGSTDPQFQQSLFELAHDHPITLNVIATEAHKYGLLDIAKRALRELQAAGGSPSDVHRLHRLLYGPPPVHPEAEYAVIENLIAQGLHATATSRTRSAQQHWPNDPHLQRYADKLAAEE